MFSTMNIHDYVKHITVEYDRQIKPRFMHYLKIRGNNGNIKLTTSEIMLTDDDFDIPEQEIIPMTLRYLTIHSSDDSIYLDGKDENIDETIKNYHANKIAMESKRGRGNYIIDGKYMAYIGTNIEDNGLRIFKQDSSYAIVPIDTLMGGNMSLFSQYYRKLVP